MSDIISLYLIMSNKESMSCGKNMAVVVKIFRKWLKIGSLSYNFKL